MSISIAILYAFVQGMSEFLPISSSGHLALFHYYFRLPTENALSYVLAAHLGTLFALLYFLRQTLLSLLRTLVDAVFHRKQAKWQLQLLFSIVLANIPALIVGLTLKAVITASFHYLWVVSLGFAFSALVWGRFVHATQQRERSLSSRAKHDLLAIGYAQEIKIYRLALIVGGMQAIAILPGVSRAGVTLATATLLGLGQRAAAQFSFLIAIPVISGSFILELSQTWQNINLAEVEILSLIILSSTLFGILALHILFKILAATPSHYFTYYLTILSSFTLYLTLNPLT